jgi:ubiquinone biosynthesis protein
MLVAEGTGRKLAPDANMWLLARPLIEDWTADTFGPEARVREAAAEIAHTLARLPELARRAERGLFAIADGYLRIHPESLRELRGRGRRSSFAGWVVAALLAVILVMVLVE